VRVEQHRSGKGARYTRGKDLELAYFETHLSRSAVMKREYEIKSYTSAKKWELIKCFQETIEKPLETNQLKQEDPKNGS
jgi:putative endonuclease